MKNIPSLQSLRAFEAAARHGSFKLAAEELNLSTSAISHQIRSLEHQLGVALFERRGVGVQINDQGKHYLASVRNSMAQLEKATLALQDKKSPNVLHLSLLSSFSTLWLIPRMEQFHRQHPEIGIELSDGIELTDFTTSTNDAAIRYDFEGTANWPGLVVHPLLEEYVFPVCSPTFLSRNPNITQLDWDEQPPILINRQHRDEWDTWFAYLEIDFKSEEYPARSIMDTSNMTLKAASQSLGIALARTPFVDQYLESGSLVQIHSAAQSRGIRNYLVYPASSANNKRLSLFREWLIEEATSCNELNKARFN